MAYRVQKNGSCMLLSFAKILSNHFGLFRDSYDLVMAAKDIVSLVGRDISEEGLTIQEIVDVLDLIGGQVTEYSDETVTLKDGTVLRIPLKRLSSRVNFSQGYWIAVFKLPDIGYHAIPIVNGKMVGIFLTVNQQIVERELTPLERNKWELFCAWRFTFDENSVKHYAAHEHRLSEEVRERLALVELTFEDFVGTGLAGRALCSRSGGDLGASGPDLSGSDKNLGEETY